MPLPPGLILNPATGELHGTPTQAGTYVIKLKVRDLLGNEREVTDTVVINPYTLMSWSGSLGKLMATRAAAQVTAAVSGGLAPITFAVASGSLPTGLSLNSSTGAITGTPTTPGAYSLVLRSTDALARTADAALSGSVSTNLTLSYGSPLNGTVGVPVSALPTATAGGAPPYTYALAAGSLPGMTVNAGTGQISGTPTSPSSAVVTLRATDADGFTADAAVTLSLAAYPTLSGLPSFSGTANVAHSSTFTGAGGHPPYVFSATGLPPGLAINASTGELSGSPSSPGEYALTITLTDALGVKASLIGQAEIAPNLVLYGTYATAVTKDVPYSFTPSFSGGYIPYTFDLSVGSLPPGLALNSTTGKISGTPTTVGIYDATLRVTDDRGTTATLPIDIEVNNTLSMFGAVPNKGTTTIAYTGDTLASAGGTAPKTWAVASGALPPGIALDAATGDLSGTPTTAGTYNFSLRVTDASAVSVQGAYTIDVAAYPALTGTLGDGSAGVAYSDKYAASGGHPPLVWSLSSGTLPAGLSLDTGTGDITGTPAATGARTFTVRVTDAAGNIADRAGTVTIYSTPSISGSIAGQAEVAYPYADTNLSATGGKPSLSWSVQGSMPPGLSLNSSSGALTGTPTTAGTYNFSIRVTDALGQYSQSAHTVNAKAHVAATATHRDGGTVGVAYSSTPAAAYGWAPYAWAVVSGALPAGLSLNPSTGELSGTPTTAGASSYTVRVTDDIGATTQFSDTITIASPAVVSGTAGGGTVGVSYSFTPSVSGGWGPYTWSLAAGSLPAGLSLDTATGRIFGTPTTAQTQAFTVLATDTSANGGSSDTHALSIQINAYPTLTLNYGRGMVGKAYSGSVSAGSGWAPYSYALAAGSLPGGTSLNTSTGAITGTPNTSGTFTPTIRLTDAKGNTKSVSVSIAIASALTISGSYASGKLGVAYSSTVSAGGGWTPRTFSLVSGTLPTGLSLSSSGTLSGTPTAVGTYNFTVRVTDADGSTYNKAMSVAIANPAVYASASPNPAYDYAFGYDSASAGITSTVTATGGTGSYTYTWSFVSSSGSSGAFTISNPASNKINAYKLSSALYYTRTETWRCTVRDSAGTTDTVDVQITLEIEVQRTGGGGGGGTQPP